MLVVYVIVIGFAAAFAVEKIAEKWRRKGDERDG